MSRPDPDAADRVADSSAGPSADSSADRAAVVTTDATTDAGEGSDPVDTVDTEAGGSEAVDSEAVDTHAGGSEVAGAAGDAPATTGGEVDSHRNHRERRRAGALFVAVPLTVALLFAAVMTVLYFVARPDPVAGLSSSQQSAVDAARQEAINLQTYRRSSFDQDFANALAGMTPDFAKTLQTKKDSLEQQLTQGNVDATASALAAGLVSSTASKATVLVVTNSVQTSDDGTTTPFVFSRLQLTLDYTGGKWLVSDLTNIGLS